MRPGCVSVDLDSLQHYYRIHALPEGLLDERGRRLVYEVALPRFLELFAQARVPATFFVIGEDAKEQYAHAPLQQCVGEGHEVASHSHAHDYSLSRAPTARIAADLAQAEGALEQACGVRPVGFRAPGYTLSAALYQATTERGYRYGSSVFPAAPYYLAKAAVMAALAAAGRPSGAILDTPRVLAAPTRPYHPDPAQPYRRGAGAVLELPISVSPASRIPFIGTLVVSAPRLLTRALYRPLRGEPLLNFELHGVDLLGQEDGLPEELVRRQRDLALPWRLKRQRLAEVFGWLREDFQPATLAQAARELVAAGSP
jgi:peptidoglycan-N-acetylglucosamine deacetylase